MTPLTLCTTRFARFLLRLVWLIPFGSLHALAQTIPLFDAHMHYSHDAVQLIPPPKAVAILKAAGLKNALISSSDDEGTQTLYKLLPEVVLPSLRPYRSRADVGTWVTDPASVDYMRERLQKYKYVAIGEFHVYGDHANSAVMKATVDLAKQYQLVLHAHGDAGAVERLFVHDAKATVLWAHSGFDNPEAVAKMLAKYPRLFCDLAFRSDYASGGKLDAAWLALFEKYPDRFMVGTDTYTPERWSYVGEHASWVRAWLADLKEPLKSNLAFANGERLFAPYKQRLSHKVSTSDCPPGENWTALKDQQGKQLFVRTAAAPKLSEMFSAELMSCAGSLKVAKLDVVMPEHKHGMNYKATIKQLDDARVHVDGLLWHMLGKWQWRVDASVAGANASQFTADVSLR